MITTTHNFQAARFTGNLACEDCGLVPLDTEDTETLCQSEAGAIRFLTKCADDNGDHWSRGIKWPETECPTCHGTNRAGHLRTPGSRYGYNGADCAPAAYAASVILAGETGQTLNTETLDYVMGLVVNDHSDPGYLIANYGDGYGFKADDYLDNPEDWKGDDS